MTLLSFFGRIALLWILVLVFCPALTRHAEAASSRPLLLECTSCSEVDIVSLLQLLGNGDRYIVDFLGRSMRKFEVSGTPAIPLGGDGEGRSIEAMDAQVREWLSAIQVTEVTLDPIMEELYQDFQALYDTNPDYFQNVQTTIWMDHPDLGVNLNTGNQFNVFDIWYYGPTNQEWHSFVNRLDQILASEHWARQVLGDVVATAIFSIFQRLNALGFEVGPGGASIGWNQAGPWTVHFCHAGYCLKVRIKPDRTFEILGAYDEGGNEVPRLFGTGWAGGFNLPTQDPGFDRLRNRLQERGIEVRGTSCAGWLMLICTYVNGVLNSCYTQMQCD